ncbi:MAG: transposase [Candidatus Sedimenticola endophacoides]
MALNDLARYSHHRGAISNRRIISQDDGVHFRYKDNADDDTTKTLRLSGEEFIRRLVYSVKRFVTYRAFDVHV